MPSGACQGRTWGCFLVKNELYLYRNPSDDPDNPADESTNPGSSPETISYSPLVTGTYYIRVYSYSGYSASPYSLRVTYD